MFSKRPYQVRHQRNQASLLAILHLSENLRPFWSCTNGRSCRQMTLFQRNSAAEKYNRRLHGGGGGIRTPGTLSGPTVFKTVGLDRSPTPPFLIVT